MDTYLFVIAPRGVCNLLGNVSNDEHPKEFLVSNLVHVSGSNLTYTYIVLAISLVALAIAYALRAQVLAADEGTDKMKEIAGAVQEGAAAYLNRQFKTLSVFVAVVFFLLFALPAHDDMGHSLMSIRIGRSIFFLLGALFLSLIHI